MCCSQTRAARIAGGMDAAHSTSLRVLSRAYLSLVLVSPTGTPAGEGLPHPGRPRRRCALHSLRPGQPHIPGSRASVSAAGRCEPERARRRCGHSDRVQRRPGVANRPAVRRRHRRQRPHQHRWYPDGDQHRPRGNPAEHRPSSWHQAALPRHYQPARARATPATSSRRSGGRIEAHVSIRALGLPPSAPPALPSGSFLPPIGKTSPPRCV